MIAELSDIYAERAKQLAIVYLTRREDVSLQPPLNGTGLDLLVALLRDGESTGRVFGVVTTAIPDNQALLPPLEMPSLPFPVCQFAFSTTAERAVWRWILEPDEDSETRLKVDTRATGVALNNTAIDHIIQRVHRWYEQRK